MKLYRYEAMRYATVIDAEYEVYGVSKARLELHEYQVAAETPKGYWISWFGTAKDKWVSKSSKKRFAHPTAEEALEAFRHRKRAFVRHSEKRLQRAREDLELVESAQPAQVIGVPCSTKPEFG